MISYKEFGKERINEVYKIYEENGWGAYLNDIDKLRRAFDNSLYILGAFDEDELVGFIRCIGDSEYILYIQDLIVKKDYQRKGIGSTLVSRVSDKYKTVRQFLLITDDCDVQANNFYKKMGLKRELYGNIINTYFRN